MTFENELQADEHGVGEVCELEHNIPREVLREYEGEKLLDRTTFFTEFSTNAYLDDFYTKVDDPAMQMVLTFLPNIVARVGDLDKVLDFGAGPTIHVAACYRDKAKEIYLADYLQQNRDELAKWIDDKATFDWSTPLKMILTREGADWSRLKEVEPATRKKIRGVFHCDCLTTPSLECPDELRAQFDAVITIFCIEYCCNNHEEYYAAIKNIAENVKPGGYLVYGGILEETWCSFGGRKFTCLYITKQIVIDALTKAGLMVEKDRTCVFYEINGMFLLCAKKI